MQLRQRIDNERETVGEVVTGSAIQPHPLAFLAGNDAEAVVLDLMQPQAPDGSLWALVGRHGAIKPAARGRNDMADKWSTCAEESSQTTTSRPGMRWPGLESMCVGRVVDVVRSRNAPPLIRAQLGLSEILRARRGSSCFYFDAKRSSRLCTHSSGHAG